MSTHWTCSTPRLNPYIERPKLDKDPRKDDEIWNKLYTEAEKLIGTSTKEFDQSIRHNLVLKTLQEKFEGKDREFRSLPLACHRLQDPEYVEWHSASRLLEELFTDPAKRGKFTLLTNHRCTRLRIKKTVTDTESTQFSAQMSLTCCQKPPTTSTEIRIHSVSVRKPTSLLQVQ